MSIFNINLPAHYWITLLVITVIYGAAVRLLLWQHLSRIAQVTFVILFATGLTLALLNIRAWGAESSFVRWFYDMDQELSIGSIFSSFQLMAAAGAALLLAIVRKDTPWWERAFWLLVAILFGFLSIDEYYELHERILEQSRYYFAFTGLVTVLLTLIVFWFRLREYAFETLGFLAGFGVMGFFGVIGEPIIWSTLCVNEEIGFICHRYNILEEFGEVAGVAISLVALISLIEHLVTPTRKRQVFAALAAISSLWLGWAVASQWVMPSLEARFLAEKTQISYQNNQFELIGYRLSSDTAKPGDQVSLLLYWRANQPLETDYSLSSHILTRSTDSKIVQRDQRFIGRYQTTAWLPGVVMRKHVNFTIPDDVDTPHSYWIMIRPWNEYAIARVTDADRQQIANDTILLTSLPVISQDMMLPENSSRYDFADGFSLASHSVPTTIDEDSFEVNFQWDVNETGSRQLVQFIHVLNQEGDSWSVYNQEPFAGNFPTHTWPADVEVIDNAQVDLDGIEPGIYDVITGFYEVASGERVPVTNEAGEPMESSTIYLGQIEVSAP